MYTYAYIYIHTFIHIHVKSASNQTVYCTLMMVCCLGVPVLPLNLNLFICYFKPWYSLALLLLFPC